jgi:rhodanese-related sulfurtransferase
VKKTLSVFFLVAALLALVACATTDSSNGKPRYTKIDATTAKELFDRGVLFIDVRTQGSYDDGHIPGAVNLTWTSGFSENGLAKVASRDQEIVIYCYGISCEMSAKATESAIALGYQEIYYFIKGFPAWWDAGYPIEQ